MVMTDSIVFDEKYGYCIFKRVDTLFYQVQLELLVGNIQERLRSANGLDAEILRNITEVSTEDEGLLIFTFNSQWYENFAGEDPSERFNHLYMEFDIIQNMMTWFAIQESAYEATRNSADEEELLKNYVEAKLLCGYEIYMEELYDMFEDIYSKEEVDAATLLQRIKDPSKFRMYITD